jgi:hypothetical protein
MTQRVGWFGYRFDEDEWEWSDEVFRIHGYEPGEVRPTTELVLSHKHPDDKDRVTALLNGIRIDHQPLSSRHRIIDARGVQHRIVVVGDLWRDGSGAIIGTQGFYINGSLVEPDTQQRITAQVAEIVKNREVIDQAKGMLMSAYGLRGDTAFEVLRWRSQTTNTKLMRLAEQLVAEFVELGTHSDLPPRSAYDNILMTLHERIDDDA